jgi:hypothetical protein
MVVSFWKMAASHFLTAQPFTQLLGGMMDSLAEALEQDPIQHPLRVWHIPQVPGKTYEVSVDSIEEGVKILDVLAKYDLFQYEENIKPDYCNAGGVEIMVNGEWFDALEEI